MQHEGLTSETQCLRLRSGCSEGERDAVCQWDEQCTVYLKTICMN